MYRIYFHYTILFETTLQYMPHAISAQLFGAGMPFMKQLLSLMKQQVYTSTSTTSSIPATIHEHSVQLFLLFPTSIFDPSRQQGLSKTILFAPLSLLFITKNYIICSSFLTVCNQIRNEALLVIVKEENNITNHEKYKGQFLG